jgi:hypothetical protein
MKLAYIVSAYKLPGQLLRLVSGLAAETSHVLVHVDKKTDDDVFRRIAEPLAPFPNVHLLERHSCHYGGFGHVQATLKGIDELFRLGLPFDYAILLTGQDYPIRSNEEIAEFFHEHRGDSFLEYFSLPSDAWADRGMNRIEAWHFRLRGRYFQFPRGTRKRFRRSFPRGLRPFGGSPYWCLSRECIEYIHAFLQRSPSYVRFFRYVDVPDEIFFHTIVLNSPLRDTVVNDDLRYLEWREPELAGGPALLGESDFDKIMSSGDLFARKFDITVDADILDMIDAQIRDHGAVS